MQNKQSLLYIITIALMIMGNLIGVGILALPVNTGLAGFIPSLLGMLIIGGAMFYTAVILGGEVVRSRKDTFNYPSLYHNYLGAVGKWIAILANLLILYGLLTAYLTGAATILTSLFHFSCSKVVMVVFALVVSGITVTSMSIVVKYNALLASLMIISFLLIVFMAEEHVDVQRLAYMDWAFLPATAPIIVTSFHFHNIIPTVCNSSKWNSAVIWKTMLLGMLLGYVMNALWIQASIGALPLDAGNNSLLAAFEQNLPATIPLAKVIDSSFFFIGALLFSLLAVTTSYFANGIGLMAFMEDLMVNQFKKRSRTLNILLSFGPPLVISLIYPDIFLKAINVVGGFGIVILFGILPCIIAIMRARSSRARVLGVLMLILFFGCLVFEIGQESGWLRIKPEVEHWQTRKKDQSTLRIIDETGSTRARFSRAVQGVADRL